MQAEALCPTDVHQIEREPARVTTQDLGRKGEDAAATYLESHGWTILERRWRCRFGEADIVAKDPDAPESSVVLVEVKTRSIPLGPDPAAAPEVAVGLEKQRRYCAIALNYLGSHPEIMSIRFDVIAISDLGTGEARLRHVMGAFGTDQ